MVFQKEINAQTHFLGQYHKIRVFCAICVR
jgi:hypothetical protein